MGATLATASALLAVIPAAAAPAVAGSPPSPAEAALAPPDVALPIDLDAQYSEFDRRRNRLVFRKLSVRQGQLSVSAEEATADPADFVASTWKFTGNVVIRNAEAEVRCASADLTFRDNVLRTAVLKGTPAEFTQPRTSTRLPTTGQARVLTYDPIAGKLALEGQARIGDGSNQITGERIDYDLRAEVVSATAGRTGPVSIRFVPEKGGSTPGTGAAPVTPPAPAPPKTP